MNNLKDLDKLIAEVLGLKENKPDKGGVKNVKASKKTTANTGLDIEDILSILSVGTETTKRLASSAEAYQTLLTKGGIQPARFTSSGALIEFFKQFDIKAMNI